MSFKNLRFKAPRVFFFVPCFLLSTSVNATVFTFEANRDTELVNNNGTATDQNFGARTNMEVGESPSNANAPRRDLVGFDVSSLQGQLSNVNVTITLQLTVSNIGALSSGIDVTGAENVNAFLVSPANAGWVEGTQTAIATASDPADVGMATWGQRIQGSQNWAGTPGLGTSGTDYLASSVATEPFGPTTAPGSIFDLTFTDTSFLADWAAGNNAGLILQTGGTADADISFFTREESNSDAPELIVTLTPAPEPSSLALFGLASIALLRRQRASERTVITI